MKGKIAILALSLLPIVGMADHVGAYLGNELHWGVKDSLTDPTFYFEIASGKTTDLTVTPPLGWKVAYWKKSNNEASITRSRSVTVAAGTTEEKIDSASAVLEWKGGTVFTQALAVLDPIDYNIAFLSGDSGATGSMDALSDVSYTNSPSLPANSFVRAGRGFKCWSETSPATGRAFADGATVDGEALGVSDDGETVTLAAQWTNNFYRVTFDANGGSAAPDPIEVEYSGKYPDLGSASKAGYEFSGWFTDRTGGTQICKGDAVELTEPTTLYAHYTATDCTLTLKVEGNGELEPYAGVHGYNYGAVVEVTATPYEGYLFSKWKEDLSIANPRKFAIAGSETWTAVFTAKLFKVTFSYFTNTTRVVETQYVEYAKSAIAPSREKVDNYKGHTFLQWDPQTYGSVTVDMDIIAKYDSKTFWVTFDRNGSDVTGTMSRQLMTCGNLQALSANVYKRESCTFTGWNRKADGSGAFYEDQALVSDLSDGEDVTLYAQWHLKSYTVEFVGNGGLGSMPLQTNMCDREVELLPNEFVKTGYAFEHWLNSATGKTYANREIVKNLAEDGQTATLNAIWSPNRYYVRFDPGLHGKGDRMAVQSFVYDQSQKLTANGYEESSGIGLWKFGGWTNLITGAYYTDENEVKNLTAVANATNVLTAVWLDNRTDVSKALGCTNLQWRVEGQETSSPYTFRLKPYKNAWATNAHGAATFENSGLTADGEGTNVLVTTISGNGLLSFSYRNVSAYGATLYVQNSTVGTAFIQEGQKVLYKFPLDGGVSDWTNVTVRLKEFWPIDHEKDSCSKIQIYLFASDRERCGMEIKDVKWQPTQPTYEVMFCYSTLEEWEREEYECDRVYRLPDCPWSRQGWKLESDGRRYDAGVLAFNLAGTNEWIRLRGLRAAED